MNTYFDVFVNGYVGYFNYLTNEILNPSWHNYFYWLLGLSLFVWLLELAFPWREEQAIFRRDFWLDGFYMFFNFFVFSLVIYNAVSNVAVSLFNDFLFNVFGISNIVSVSVAALPTWVQWLTLFVARDFIQWNVHRLFHSNPFLWSFHQVHHSIEQMGFAGHFRYHWGETIVYRTLEYVPLAMIGFGIDDFFVVHMFTLAVGHLNHANINLRLGVFKYIFNNPQMHIWHHAKELPNAKGANFGLTLSLWDYLFKTAYIPSNGKDIKLGFGQVETFPHRFWQQMKYPFQKKKR